MNKKLLNRRLDVQRIGLLFSALLLSIFWSTAQTGYREKENIDYLPTSEISQTLQRLRSLRTTLPSRVDNSQTKYMPIAVDQGSMGSCGSASRICHMFAYEINNYRNLNGKVNANMYPSHFTWMLTGQNSDKENMAIFNGIPTIQTYGGRQYNPVYGGNVSWPDKYKAYGWMTGYDKWRSAMDNRLEKTANFQLKTDDDIEYLKWWIYNHHGDDSFNLGGVAGAGAASNGWTLQKIPAGSYRAGETIITAYGQTIDHGVVWAGYDDDIEFDLNGNGQIDADERGALIMMNSWGVWGNNGCAYVPYKIAKTFNGGLGVELYYIRKDYKPVDVFRIKMDYDQRCNIKISIGVSGNPDASVPDKTIEAEHFKYAGFEPIPLLGEYSKVLNSNPMEFGLDLTDLTDIGIDIRKEFRYFLVLETAAKSTGVGSVQELEVIRHSYPEGSDMATEIAGKIESKFLIAGGGQKFIIPISVAGIAGAEPSYLYVPQNRLSVKAYSTQETSGEGANNGRAVHAIDGNQSTFWHSAWSSGTPAYPHSITFAIDSTYMLNGFEYLPRQNHTNGRIADYELFVSDTPDGEWVLAAKGTFENSSAMKRAFFEPLAGKYVKLVNYRAANGDNNTCMAEFNLFYKAPPLSGSSIRTPEQKSLLVRQEASTLLVSGVSGEAHFILYTAQGQTVATKRARVTESEVTNLDLSRLPRGTYLLRVNTPDGVSTSKVLLR